MLVQPGECDTSMSSPMWGAGWEAFGDQLQLRFFQARLSPECPTHMFPAAGILWSVPLS